MIRSRPSWDEYFLGLVDAVAERATCDRGRSGALLVVQRQIVATGYVGSPSGFPHCDNVGHHLEVGGDGREHCVRTVHAEQNALASAARFGVSVLGATSYSTMVPCRVCAMLLLTAGVDRVIARFSYQDTRGLDVLRHAGVEVVVYSQTVPYVPGVSS